MSVKAIFCYNTQISMPNTHPTPPPPPNPAAPNTPEWLYNEIMRHIEPDLMLEHIPQLDEWYKDETPEKKEERLASYDKAFELFAKASSELGQMTVEEAEKVKKKVHAKAVKQETEEHREEIDSAEAALDSDDDA